MLARGRPALIGAAACFAVFFLNIVFGAMGKPVFLTDVLEMLALFAAVLLFVAGVLVREARDSSRPPEVERSHSE